MPPLGLMQGNHKKDAEAFQKYTARGGGESCSSKCGSLKLRLFYQLEIMWFFSPTSVLVRLITSWGSIAITIMQLLGYDYQLAKIAGGVAIFIGSLNLNLFHGFAKYPSLAKRCAHANDDKDEPKTEFNAVRDIASSAYNGDKKRRSQMLAIILTLPWTIPLHIASLITSLITYSLTCWCSKNGKVKGWVGLAGIIVACAFFPFIYIFGVDLYEKYVFGSDFTFNEIGVTEFTDKYVVDFGVIYAQVGLIATENLYDSMFFRKSFWQFLTSFFTGFLDISLEDVGAGGVAVTAYGNADVEMGDGKKPSKKPQGGKKPNGKPPAKPTKPPAKPPAKPSASPYTKPPTKPPTTKPPATKPPPTKPPTFVPVTKPPTTKPPTYTKPPVAKPPTTVNPPSVKPPVQNNMVFIPAPTTLPVVSSTPALAEETFVPAPTLPVVNSTPALTDETTEDDEEDGDEIEC